GVDIAGEDPKEIVDDASAAHGSMPLGLKGRGRRGRAAEETVTRFRPNAHTFAVLGRLLAKLLAPALPFAQRVTRGLLKAGRRECRSLFLAGHLDRGRRDGDRDEYDCAQPGPHIAVHDGAPLLA